MKYILKWMKFMYIGLQEPEEEVHIPLKTHSEVNEGVSCQCYWYKTSRHFHIQYTTYHISPSEQNELICE